MKRTPLVLAVVLLCAAPWRASQAQAASELLQQGISAYQGLDFEGAVRLLDRALSPGMQGSLSDQQRLQGLTYLTACQLFRNQKNEASTALRQALQIDPRYQPDSLLFPPPVRDAFDEARRTSKIASVVVPPQSTMLVGRDTLPVRVYATSQQEITASVGLANGTAVRQLYQGPILDSLTLHWDGRDASGATVGTGQYRLTVVSRASEGGDPLRSVAVPLKITASRPDTLRLPALPPDSVLLPERSSARPGLTALAFGVLGAGLTAVLPDVAGAGSDGSGRRFVVAGAIGLAGIVGLVHHGLGHPLPDNIAANARRREAWRSEMEKAQQANSLTRSATELRIEAAPAVHTEGPSR